MNQTKVLTLVPALSSSDHPQTNHRKSCWPDDLSQHLPCVFLAQSPCGSTPKTTALLPVTQVGSMFSKLFPLSLNVNADMILLYLARRKRPSKVRLNHSVAGS